jgi:hypothetical protein
MNHKLYESWILDEPQLSAEQKKELAKHLSVCPQCSHLDTGWQASKRLMSQAAKRKPADGFAMRWQDYAEKKRNLEKVRRYRLSLIGGVIFLFMSSLAYMILSGSVMRMLADTFNGIANIIINITSGLSTFGQWLYRMPIAVPLTLGFIFFGLVNAFIMVALFTLWNLKQRKVQTNEIEAE